MSGGTVTGRAAASETPRLLAAAATLGVPLDAAQGAALLRLLDELARWNRAYNLTALHERGAMIVAHLLDSLSAAPDLHGERIADVGTGAGFPGLPLAVAAPQRQFTLIEATAKKIRFVTHVVRRLGLPNVTVLNARVETLSPTPPFDTVIARAYAPLPRLLADVGPLLGPAGRVVAMKGRDPQTELSALPPGWRLEQLRAVRIPGLAAQRHLLRLTRVA